MRSKRPYGAKCKKCGRLIIEKGTQCIVYAHNMDEACAELNDAIKTHDLRCDPNGGFAEFKIVRLERKGL
jgi:hypothetical protein